MSISLIIKELKHHAPFTLIGSLSGIIIFVLFKNIPYKVSYEIFYILHPLHVLLSGMVTASLYNIYRYKHEKKKSSLLVLLLIGYLGAIGIATISDSIIPYISEVLLDMPKRHIHIGFIEKWWIVNPMAVLGVAIAYFKPKTEFPHFGHVLLSTWASLFHIITAQVGLIQLNWISFFSVFIFLFLAVWLPCCISDIIFPMLFIKKKNILGR